MFDEFKVYRGQTPRFSHLQILFLIKLLIESKPIVCLPWEILHYKISREKLEPEPGFEPRRSAT